MQVRYPLNLYTLIFTLLANNKDTAVTGMTDKTYSPSYACWHVMKIRCVTQEKKVIDYNNILVAMDFSPAAEKAAHQAGEFSSLIGAKITLLHILEHFPEDIPNNIIAPENTNTEQFYVEQARARLIELRNHLNHDDSTTAMEIIVSTAVDVVVSPRSAGQIISEYASQHDMDLIVMGSHGKHGLLGAIGSTASKVLHTTSTDVLVVKP